MSGGGAREDSPNIYLGPCVRAVVALQLRQGLRPSEGRDAGANGPNKQQPVFDKIAAASGGRWRRVTSPQEYEHLWSTDRVRAGRSAGRAA